MEHFIEFWIFVSSTFSLRFFTNHDVFFRKASKYSKKIRLTRTNVVLKRGDMHLQVILILFVNMDGPFGSTGCFKRFLSQNDRSFSLSNEGHFDDTKPK